MIIMIWDARRQTAQRDKARKRANTIRRLLTNALAAQFVHKAETDLDGLAAAVRICREESAERR